MLQPSSSVLFFVQFAKKKQVDFIPLDFLGQQVVVVCDPVEK